MMLLLLFIAAPISVFSNTTICSHFGFNWAAEIRCLRFQLAQCQAVAESVVRDPSFDKLVENITRNLDRGLLEIGNKLESEQKRRISELQGRLESNQRIIESRSDRKSEEMKRRFETELKTMTKRIDLMASPVHKFGSFEYVYIKNRESWYVAEEQCVLWGGHLASISSFEENRFIAGLLRSESCWIGLNDVQLENAFVNSDKTTSTYQHFAPGQPDNAGHNENCVELSVSGAWSDLFCLVTRPYVCKR